MSLAATDKGKTISREVENVVPSKQWDNVVRYEDSQMAYTRLIEDLETFPSEPVSIDEKRDKSISSEVPWGSELSILLTGEGTAHFVGEEKVTVEAGTFNCWRINYTGSVSGEGKVDSDHTITVNWTVEENVWYNRRNCAMIKLSSSYRIDWRADDYYPGEQIPKPVVELVDYGMTDEKDSPETLSNSIDLTIEPDLLHVDDPYSLQASLTNGESNTMTITDAVLRVYLDNQLFDESPLTSEIDNTVLPGKTEQIWQRTGNFTGDTGDY